IILAAVAVDATTGRDIDDSLNRAVVPAQDPLAPVTQPGGGLDQPVGIDPAPGETAPAADDPLAGVAQSNRERRLGRRSSPPCVSGTIGACAEAVRTLKARLPWRGSFLSPAAWSHRLARV